MKKFAQILVFFYLVGFYGQTDFSNRWEDFYSYNNVKDFVKTESFIYALADNSIFSYNSVTSEISKLSSVNGLSGETTSSLFYSETFEKLIIGYENGLIEIVDKFNAVTAARDIVIFNYSGNKRINDIAQYENNLFIATPFAVVVYNLDKEEFGDTYFIGPGSSEMVINKIKIVDSTLYAATQNGLYKADLKNQNLIDYNNWNLIATGDFSNIAYFNNTFYLSQNNALYTLNNGSLTLQQSFSKIITNLKATTNHLTVATGNGILVYNLNLVEILNYVSEQTDNNYFNVNAALFENETLLVATKEFGILKSSLQNISEFEEIHPSGPTSNLPFSIAAENNNLWIVYGAYRTSYSPMGKRLGFSHFNGENWINTPYDNELAVKDLVHITIDPNHNNKAYLSSWGSGMLVVENDEITEFWTHENSGLEKLIYTPNPNYVSIRINGSSFDNQGNLWIANAWVDKRIKKYSTNGTWSAFDMSTVMTNPALGLNELEIDKLTTIWIGSRRNGVLVFNESGNKKRALTTETTKGSLPDLNVRTVLADNSNTIWLGTKKGLVVLYNATNVFNEVVIDAEPIIILDDGIPKKLLGEQPINTIETDGADNKWIGTETSGAVQTNSNGSEILQLFNKNNSPLPSNNILKIAVDKSSGKVYFATDKGIVAFNSNVAPYGDTLPEVYAYPNPSTKNNNYITIDGRNGAHLPIGTNVKIIDIAGNLVFETSVKEGQELFGGKVIWDKTNLSGKKVASGIYLVMLTANNNSETTISKIAIIN